MLIEDSKDTEKDMSTIALCPPHGGPWGYLYVCSTQPVGNGMFDVCWLGVAWRIHGRYQ